MSQLASRSTSYSLRKSRHDQGNHQHTGVVLLTSIRPVTEHVLPGDFLKFENERLGAQSPMTSIIMYIRYA